MLNLPVYHATNAQKESVEGKRRTAKFVTSLWKAADKKQRGDPAFLCLLTQCGWTNRAEVRGPETTRLWRNRRIAKYLGGTYKSDDDELARRLCKALPRLPLQTARGLLGANTGVTHYRNSFRTATLNLIEHKPEVVRRAFEKASTVNQPAEQKAFVIASAIEGLGTIKVGKTPVSMFNGLTPILACLDPQRRFPIMNQKTRALLARLGFALDADGIRQLVRLIGRGGIGVTDSFVLDAYALFQKFPPLPERRKSTAVAETEYRELGFKSEAESIAKINAKRTTITRTHNALTNRFKIALLGKQRLAPKEYRFDALVEEWKKGRNLLVEAKTVSEGPVGRMQVRQAIGQLFDYRFTYFQNEKKLDMAVLLYKRPSEDVRKLLASLQIESLWFEGKRLTGTIRLSA